MQILILFIISILLGPSFVHADELNAGFVQGLWYSSETVFADEPVRIYVALRNNTDKDLTGTVRFTDNEKRIGTAHISALPGRLVEAWTDWTPRYGEHTVTAVLTDIKLNTIGESAHSVEVVSALAEDALLVDYDTDNDGIGNAEDTDDDGDGIEDDVEEANGTDPLVFTETENTEQDQEEEINETTRSAETEQEEIDIPKGSEAGLEQFFDDGAIDAILSNVTEKVTGTKQSLDEYRKTRISTQKSVEEAFEKSQAVVDDSTATTVQLLKQPEELATITRYKIEDDGPGVIAAFMNGISAIVQGLYSLILWSASSILAHPALVQIVLLISILYIFYRVARRIGRRPQ